MAGMHKFEIKFLADIDEIVKKFEAALGQLQQIAQQRSIDLHLNYLGPDGKPVTSLFGGGQGQGVNVQASAGTTMHGRTPLSEIGVPIVGAGAGPQGPYKGTPGPQSSIDASPWDRYRMTDPNYRYMEFERQTRAREDQYNVRTYGRGSEFLSERIGDYTAKHGGTTDVRTQELIRSLTAMKATVDAATKSLEELTTEQANAVGNVDRTVQIAEQRTNLERIRGAASEQILGVTGGGGGGGGDSFIARAVKAIGIEFATQRIQNILTGPGRALGFQASAAGPLNTFAAAATRLNAEDILSTLNPEVMSSAFSAGMGAGTSSIVGPAGRALAAGQVGGPVAAGAAGLGSISDWVSAAYYGGNPRAGAAGEAINAALGKWAEIKGVEILAGSIALDRSRGRMALQQTFGITNSALTSFGMSEDPNSFYSVGKDFGISESEQIRGLMGFARFGSPRRINRGVARLSLAGFDASSQAEATGQLFGGDVAESHRRLEDLFARAMTRGLNDSEVAKNQVMAIASLVAGSGAPGMPGDPRLAEAAMRMFNGNPLAGSIVQSGMGQIYGERNQRGGLQGLMNAITAKAVVSQIPGLDVGRRAQLMQILGGHDPSQWENILGAVGDEFGLNKGSAGEMSRTGMQLGEQFRMKLFGIGGSNNPLVNELMLNPNTNAAQVIQQFRIRSGFARGEFGGGEAPANLEDRFKFWSADSPIIQQMQLLEKNSQELAFGGFAVLNTALGRLKDNLPGIVAILEKAAGLTNPNARPVPPSIHPKMMKIGMTTFNEMPGPGGSIEEQWEASQGITEASHRVK